MSETVLILGGTREAASLAADLVAAHPDWRVITSLAGRTQAPEPVAGEMRIGGFGGAAGLADYIGAEGVTRLIDATHPFARQISANARAAVEATGIAFEVRTRPPWHRQAGDQWIEVVNEAEATRAIPIGARVLLALGSQHLAPFARRDDVHFVVRMVDPPAEPLPLAQHVLIKGKPGATADAEANLMRAHAIAHVVARNSGGAGGYAKIAAARSLGIPVIMITR